MNKEKLEKRIMNMLEINFPQSEIRHGTSSVFTSDFFIDGNVVRVFHMTLNYIVREVRLKKHGLNQYKNGGYELFFITRRYDYQGNLMHESKELVYHYASDFFRTAYKKAMELKEKYGCIYVFEDMKENDCQEFIQR